MGMTPTQRTIKALRAKGMKCGIVEKWNRFVPRANGGMGVRQDLFGIIDIIALDPERGVVGVQSTGQDFAGHHKKLTGERASECIMWLSTPGTCLELWGWRKLKPRGSSRPKWEPRVKEYTLNDFNGSNDPLEDTDE